MMLCHGTVYTSSYQLRAFSPGSSSLENHKKGSHNCLACLWAPQVPRLHWCFHYSGPGPDLDCSWVIGMHLHGSGKLSMSLFFFKENLSKFIKFMHVPHEQRFSTWQLVSSRKHLLLVHCKEAGLCFPMHHIERLVLQFEFLLVRVTFSANILHNGIVHVLPSFLLHLTKNVISCTDCWILSLEITHKTSQSFAIQSAYIRSF